VSELIAALATPPGGALGVVRLSGEGALAAAMTFLEPKSVPERRPVLRDVLDGGSLLDLAVVTCWPEGRSYTGEEIVEISAHGSPYVLGRILELCLAAGARQARPGEFTQRAYLQGKLDLDQAEAVCDLILSQTRLAHRSAVARLEGGLSKSTARLRGLLVGALASLEASLDHPGEEAPPRPEEELREACREAGLLLEAAGRGRILSAGARVVIVGRPNAGKSSLLNALAGQERAIVSEEPGTTRDAVSEPCDLGGLKGLLIDTAGLREEAGAGPVEREGMRRTRTQLESADLVLLVVDRSAPLASQAALFPLLNKKPAVVALNKCDLPSAFPAAELRRAAGNLPVAEVSAARRAGLDRLCEAARSALLPASVPCELSVSVRHAAALGACLRELEAARLRPEPELAAEHLRRALAALDAVCGLSVPDDVLAQVFARFCVGK